VADSSRHRKSHKGPRSAKRNRTRRRAAAEPDLLDEVRHALAEPNPMPMLSYVSMLLCLTEPPRALPFADPTESDSPRVSLDELVSMFIDVALPETSALLAVIAEMVADDDLLRARIRRELAARPEVEPSWIGGLSDLVVHRAVRTVDELGDGDDILLGIRLEGDHEFTCLVFLDHNVGSIAKDAFAIPESIGEVLVRFRSLSEEPGIRYDDIDLADARACIEQGIQRAAITYPPFETETWPASKPLVNWLIRRLPEGGSVPGRPQWSSDALADLVQRFFASPEGARIDDHDHRELLDSVLWYGTDYGSGDPLRWSPVKIEILLADWIPRKIVAPAQYLAKAPDLLRAFIRFVHTEVGLRPGVTADALAAIDAWEPAYQQTIRTPRPQGPAALLASLGVGGDDVDDSSFESSHDVRDIPQWVLDGLARQVGGQDRLDGLDDEPLSDEPFDWVGIPDDIADRVRDVLVLVDDCCGAMFDVEVRTGCRRLLARVASVGPEAFRRKARAENSAAAVVWMIGKVNDVFNIYRPGRQVKDVMSHFGLKGSASQRAGAMLETAGFESRTYDLSLGSPDYLVAARRRHMIEVRDQYRDLADDAIDLDR
jgi:hypothetical protein